MADALVSLSLIAFLATAAVANFSGVFNKANAEIAIASLQSAIAYAQSEALTRSAANQGQVKLCAMNAAQDNCVDTDGLNWNYGWIVYVNDPNVTPSIQHLRLFPIAKQLSISTDIDIEQRKLTIRPRSMPTEGVGNNTVEPVFKIALADQPLTNPPLFTRQLTNEGWVEEQNDDKPTSTTSASPNSSTMAHANANGSPDTNKGDDSSMARLGKKPGADTANETLPTF